MKLKLSFQRVILITTILYILDDDEDETYDYIGHDYDNDQEIDEYEEIFEFVIIFTFIVIPLQSIHAKLIEKNEKLC